MLGSTMHNIVGREWRAAFGTALALDADQQIPAPATTRRAILMIRKPTSAPPHEPVSAYRNQREAEGYHDSPDRVQTNLNRDVHAHAFQQ
jgi:hypothetical protein